MLELSVASWPLSGIVKLGWEVMFPPRTPERNATNPPQELLQQLGFSSEFTHQTYTFSNMELPWVSFILQVFLSSLQLFTAY